MWPFYHLNWLYLWLQSLTEKFELSCLCAYHCHWVRPFTLLSAINNYLANGLFRKFSSAWSCRRWRLRWLVCPWDMASSGPSVPSTPLKLASCGICGCRCGCGPRVRAKGSRLLALLPLECNHRRLGVFVCKAVIKITINNHHFDPFTPTLHVFAGRGKWKRIPLRLTPLQLIMVHLKENSCDFYKTSKLSKIKATICKLM